MAEIDYGSIKPDPVHQPSSWRPPRHVYFGPKGEDGTMAEEPKYVHQNFPKMVYTQANGKISAHLVNTQEELSGIEGYKESPADFGVITAPAFGQKTDAKTLGLPKK